MSLPLGMSPIYLGGLVVLCLALLLHIIGLATPQWSKHEDDDDTSFGLWEFCYRDKCDEIDSDAKTSKLEACEAFAIIGMLAGLASIALAVVQVVLKRENFTFAQLSAGVAFLTSVFIFIAVIIWGAKLHDDADEIFKRLTGSGAELGYSFALSLVGAILFIIGGVLAFIGVRTNEK